MHKLKLEVTKFTIVGASNFVLTFVIFFTLVKINEVDYVIALLVASLIGVLFTYTFNFVWVFKPEQQLLFKGRFIKYLLANLVSIFFNLIILKSIVELTHFDPFYVQTALIPFVVIFNFSTAKFWSLRPVKVK